MLCAAPGDRKRTPAAPTYHLMLKLRTFLRRHLLWAVFLAVAVPLLCILALQYRSLAKLEKTSTLAETATMKNYLDDVSKEVKYFYKGQAEQALNVPAHTLAAADPEKVRHYFGRCDVAGARRLFVVSFGAGGEARKLFFDPRRSSEPVPLTAEEERAVSVATATFRLLNHEGTPVPSAGATDYLRELDYKVTMKPVLDDARRVAGVAGMILDADYFRREYLPQLVRHTLPKFFPDGGHENVVVTLHDMKESLIYSTEPPPFREPRDEAAVWLPFFHEYRLGIRSRHMTPAQWAHWNFQFNFALSALMTAVLVAGIALALRTASREIRLSQMKTDFVSNVSHELRTPLASIRVFGEFLKLGRVRDAEKVREYGEYIETESRRLTQLINNILDFSKIESDRKTYQFERADLGELARATLKTFDVQLKQQGFAVRLEEANEPPSVLVDADAFGQVFMNLLDNAVKYSGESREILVRVERRDGEARVSVRDFGVGIPREEQAKIFEKFYRVSTGLVHDVKGSGLGLSLVRHIVKAHGGRVLVESEPGKGSTFTVALPAAGTVGEKAARPEGSSAPPLDGAAARV